jgi:hypothetical protein
MMHVEELVKVALVGTQKYPAAESPAAHAADALAAKLPETSAERKLLFRAAASSVFLNAGQLARTKVEPPAAAPPERRPVCGPRAAGILGDLFQGAQADADVLLEALRLTDEAGYILPPALLPTAISQSRRELRRTILPVLGERGRWLAAFNDEWKWVGEAAVGLGELDCLPENADQLWQEGNSATRRELLARVRQVDPAQARQWLTDAWAAEKAEQRLAFLETFATGLGDDDISFLERALTDRSSNVRAKAAELLARLPNSGLAQRMRERGAAMLRYAPPKKRGALAGAVGAILGKKQDVGQLEITPPKSFDKEWAKDGIDEKPPAGIGERAHWLKQVIGLVPPAFWTEQFASSPAELVAAALTTDFDGPILEAWSVAALRANDQMWIAALWDAWFDQSAVAKRKENEVRLEWLTKLLAQLPTGEAEERLRRFLAQASAVGHIEVQPLVDCLPRPWSEDIGKFVLDWLRQKATAAAESDKPAYESWPAALGIAATALPPSCLPDAIGGWPVFDANDFHNRYLKQELQRFMTTVTLRQRFRELLQSARS